MRTTFIRGRWGLAIAVAVLCTSLALLLSGTTVEAAPAPTIIAVSAATGPMAGGAALTITGTGFDPAATVDHIDPQQCCCAGTTAVVGTPTCRDVGVAQKPVVLL